MYGVLIIKGVIVREMYWPKRCYMIRRRIMMDIERSDMLKYMQMCICCSNQRVSKSIATLSALCREAALKVS